MDWFKKKFFWFTLLAVIVFLTDIYLFVNKETLKSTITFLGLTPKSLTAQGPAHKSLEATATSVNSEGSNGHDSPQSTQIPAFESNTNKTTPNNSTYLTDNPETEELKIIERANSLKANEIKTLKENSVDTSLNQDLRFESVYLLSKSNYSSKELAQIILTPIPDSIKDRMLDFENILRAQAVEGIQNSPDQKKSISLLKEIMNKTDNVFLLERMRKAQLFLKNGGDSLEVQDKKQLEKVLGN
jgi:hypothetical protein